MLPHLVEPQQLSLSDTPSRSAARAAVAFHIIRNVRRYTARIYAGWPMARHAAPENALRA